MGNSKKLLYGATTIATLLATGVTTKTQAVHADTNTDLGASQTVSSQSAFEQAKTSEQAKLDSQATANKSAEVNQQSANSQALTSATDSLAVESQALPASQANDVKKFDADTSAGTDKTSAEASQAVTSFAASQGLVTSQAASVASQEVNSYQTVLDNDPARNANQQRSEAATVQSQAAESANAEQTQANNDALVKQSQANSQASANKSQADSTAQATQSAADAAANTAQQTANEQAVQTRDAAIQAATQTENTADAQAKQDYIKGIDPTLTTTAENATSKLTADQKTVNDAIANIPYIATPDYDDGQSGQHIIQQEDNLPVTLLNPQVPADHANDDYAPLYYGSDTGAKDTSEVVNGALTDAQEKELADYAVTLIDSYHQQEGLAPVVWDARAQNIADQITRLRENENIGFDHTYADLNSSLAKQADQIFSNVGGVWDAGENMGAVMNNDRYTMTYFKTAILNTISSMIYQDGGANNWGHRNNFRNFQGIGVTVQKNNGSESNSFPYLIVFTGMRTDQYSDWTYSGDSMPLTSAKTIRANIGPSKAQLQAVVDDRKAVDQANRDVQTATAKLKADYADALNAADAARTTAVNAANSAWSDAKSKNDSDQYNAIKQHAQDLEFALETDANNYNDAISKAVNAYTQAIKDAQTAYDTAIGTAKSTHDTKIAAIDKTYNDTMTSLHDETPAERTARHDAAMKDFKSQEDLKLKDLATKQASDLVAFKVKEAQLIADYKSQRASLRNDLLASQKEVIASLPAVNAKKLAGLKQSLDEKFEQLVQSDKDALANAKVASQKFLDSIDPSKQSVKTTPSYPNKTENSQEIQSTQNNSESEINSAGKSNGILSIQENSVEKNDQPTTLGGKNSNLKKDINDNPSVHNIVFSTPNQDTLGQQERFINTSSSNPTASNSSTRTTTKSYIYDPQSSLLIPLNAAYTQNTTSSSVPVPTSPIRKQQMSMAGTTIAEVIPVGKTEKNGSVVSSTLRQKSSPVESELSSNVIPRTVHLEAQVEKNIVNEKSVKPTKVAKKLEIKKHSNKQSSDSAVTHHTAETKARHAKSDKKTNSGVKITTIVAGIAAVAALVALWLFTPIKNLFIKG